jgi:hypothetical protein
MFDKPLQALLGKVPETWNSLEEFAQWYIDNQIPYLIPNGSGSIVTDDATAISIFRKPPYQVELYIIHPNVNIKLHSHPNVETLTVMLGGQKTAFTGDFGTSDTFNRDSRKVSKLEKHGKFTESGYSNEGFAMLSFQKWDEHVPITSAALNWRGPPAGPIHARMLGKNYE